MEHAVLSAPKFRQLPRNIPSAEDFLDFFHTKVENVHKDTGRRPAMTFVSSARDLGVVIDSQLSMADHVASVCRSAYYHLR